MAKWKNIEEEGFEGYEISDLGEVRIGEKIIEPKYDENDENYYVFLRNEKKEITKINTSELMLKYFPKKTTNMFGAAGEMVFRPTNEGTINLYSGGVLVFQQYKPHEGACREAEDTPLCFTNIKNACREARQKIIFDAEVNGKHGGNKDYYWDVVNQIAPGFKVSTATEKDYDTVRKIYDRFVVEGIVAPNRYYIILKDVNGSNAKRGKRK